MGFLKGKTAIITGAGRAVLSNGKSGSIGYGIAHAYAKEGANLVITGRNVSKLEGAKEELEKLYGIKVLVMQADVNASADNEAVVQSVIDKTMETFGRIDVLINNAGISQKESIYDYDVKDFEKAIDLNVNAVFVCSQAAAKIMKEQGEGVILNTSSMVSIYGQPSGCGYPTSKFALNGLTKSLARELAKDNIRVNAVAPGVTKTDIVANLPDSVIQPIIKTIPLGRMGEPEDIANAFIFLASDMASYITGDILSVDGCARS